MKVIGNRISVLKKDDLLSVVILPLGDKRKLALMFMWILAWSVCGVIVFANYFKIREPDAKLFILVYLSFWAYFEFKILRAFTWRKWGKEKIWIQNNVLYYQKEVNGKGRISQYELELVDDLKLIDLNDRSFSDFINQSFWIKGGERLQFSYQSRILKFAMQLSDAEAKSVLRELRDFTNK
jgi:hypothetical protein